MTLPPRWDASGPAPPKDADPAPQLNLPHHDRADLLMHFPADPELIEVYTAGHPPGRIIQPRPVEHVQALGIDPAWPHLRDQIRSGAANTSDISAALSSQIDRITLTAEVYARILLLVWMGPHLGTSRSGC